MPIVMATGQAAGVCAALAARRDVTPRAVPVSEVQETLFAQGADLGQARQLQYGRHGAARQRLP